MTEVNSPEPTPGAASDASSAATGHEKVTESSAMPGDWRIVHVKMRVDSFNQGELLDDLRNLRVQGHKKLALDLKDNRFLSLPVIRFCVDAARDLHSVGGVLALIGPSEKTKRHFEIYGSLKYIRVVRAESDLTKLRVPQDS